MIKVLAIGDVVGRSGRRMIEDYLPKLRDQHQPDVVLLNGENLAGGYGINLKIFNQFIDELGVDCITTGNHWHDHNEVFSLIEKTDRLLLPANMSNVKNEELGFRILKSKTGVEFAVMNFIGRAFMHDNNRNPFESAARILAKIPSRIRLRIVDIHAEATSEKQAMAVFLDGKVSLVYGTHSHVPTADLRILGGGTGFVTDLGATGAYDSIIGMRKEQAMQRFLSGQKMRLEPAEGDPWLCAVLGSFEPESGLCASLERIILKRKDLE